MKGIIFDLDGTLVNTLDDINHAVNAMLEDYGIPVILILVPAGNHGCKCITPEITPCWAYLDI